MFGWGLVSISRILNLLETNDIKMYTMTSIPWILCQAMQNQLSSLFIPLCQPAIRSNILCLGTPQLHGTGTLVGDFHSSCSPLEIFQSHPISVTVILQESVFPLYLCVLGDFAKPQIGHIFPLSCGPSQLQLLAHHCFFLLVPETQKHFLAGTFSSHTLQGLGQANHIILHYKLSILTTSPITTC